ncbi:MAG: hypothetical protein R2873_11050 [Caldilineaceae bacterium]
MSDPQEPEIRPRRLPNLPIEVAPLRSSVPGLPKSLHALRHRNFQLYIAGQLLSGMGTGCRSLRKGGLLISSANRS